MSQASIENIRQNGLNSVVIAICTYKRPNMLDACLNSLIALNVADDIHPHILVIDNDPKFSAHNTYCKWSKNCHFAHSYITQPKRGIAAARNRAVAFASENGADHILFIDDDEVAHPDWLAGLMHPDYIKFPIVSGWQIMDYPESIPEWARPHKSNPKLEGSKGIPACNNARIAMSVFERLRFNEKLGLGGGEDGELFARARSMGLESRFTRRAITYETAHPGRHTLMGIINRTYWVAAAGMRERIIISGRARAIFGKCASIIFSSPIASGHIVAGLVVFAFHTTDGRRIMLKGCMIMAKALGRIAAIYGYIPQSYTSTVGR